MESIVRTKIVNHMERNNIFSDKQHGFVPLRNCMSNLLICMEKWTDMLEKGHSIDIILYGFCKSLRSRTPPEASPEVEGYRNRWKHFKLDRVISNRKITTSAGRKRVFRISSSEIWYTTGFSFGTNIIRHFHKRHA